VEVRAAAREALDQDVREIASQMPKVVRDVPLDEGKRPINARERVVGVDVRPRIADDDGDAPHEVTRYPGIGFLLAEEANQVGQHVSAFN
jgi:hypothetical protein